MSLKQVARELRRHQTDEENELWRALRGRRFAGFKFRRQHVVGDHILDLYCADAKLAVEMDGSQHGQPEGIKRDTTREIRAKNFSLSKALRHCDFGIINGTKTAKVVCWKFGMRFNKDQAAFA